MIGTSVRLALSLALFLAAAASFAQEATPTATPSEEPTAVDAETPEPSPEPTEAPVPVVDPDRSSVRYDISVREDGNDLTGTARISIDPVGAARLDTVVLFLFPNILQERLAGEDSRSYFTIHPARFRRGGMRLTALTLADGTALPWTGVDLARPDGRGGVIFLPQGTAIRATLPEPASGTIELVAEFEVHVPERFGTFSWYDRDLFLTGGWYPLVAARTAAGEWDLSGDFPRVDAKVSLDVRADHWALLGDELSPPGEGTGGRRTVVATVRSRPHVLLLVSDSLYVKQGEGVKVLQPEKSVRLARRERDSAEDALAFLAKEHVIATATSGGGISVSSEDALLYEAPLTRELTFHDAPVGVFSFRTYRVLPFLKRYHDVHVARAAIAAKLRDHVYELEPGDDASWVLDVVVWHLALRYQDESHKDMRDVRDYARPFSFIPAVDLVLNTPDFPFAAEYYDNWYFTDLVRDDVTRFHHLRPNGRVAFEKLVDLLGAEKANEIVAAYLTAKPEDGGFRAVAARTAGRDLGWFFDQWRAPLPRVNYVLEKLLLEKTKNGEWVTQVKLRADGKRVNEPVEVRARAKGLDAHETWNPALEGEKTVELFTQERPKAIELDWRGRLFETNRRDNRFPPVWRTLLQYAWVDYEFKLNTLDAAVGLQFERSNDLSEEIDLGAFYLQQSRGAQLGYVHSFGPPTFYRGLLHRIGAFLLLEDLDEEFGKDGLKVVPGFDPEISKVDKTLGINGIYRYDSRDDWRFSRFGTRGFLSAEVGTSISKQRSRYQLVEGDIVHIRRLTDNNVFAVQLKGGTFVGTNPKDVPLSKLFYLGGIDDNRGISTPDITGPTKFLSTFEWRHFAMHDVDANLYMGRVRSVQGAVFVDSGYISPGTRHVPPVNDWITSTGYGLRLHYDLFGIRPMVFRLDVAQRVDDLDRRDWQRDIRFYIGAGQSF